MFQRRGSELLGVMSLSESEFYEAGMSLPPDVRNQVAVRLLASVDSHEAFDLASEVWLLLKPQPLTTKVRPRPMIADDVQRPHKCVSAGQTVFPGADRR